MHRNLEVRLITAKPLHQTSSKMPNSKAMLKPIVRCTREYKIRCTQLFEVTKSLEFRSVYDLESIRVHQDVPMNRVIK